MFQVKLSFSLFLHIQSFSPELIRSNYFSCTFHTKTFHVFVLSSPSINANFGSLRRAVMKRETQKQLLVTVGYKLNAYHMQLMALNAINFQLLPIVLLFVLDLCLFFRFFSCPTFFNYSKCALPALQTFIHIMHKYVEEVINQFISGCMLK